MKAGLACIALTLLLFAGKARAVLPSEELSDPKLEMRARAISQELRCVVCQNETIDDSDAPLAHDLRVLLRSRLKAGDSDRQAIDFVAARYGSFVLLRPPVNAGTVPLWFGPFAILILGGLGVALYLRRRTGEASFALSENEESEVERILQRGDGA